MTELLTQRLWISELPVSKKKSNFTLRKKRLCAKTKMSRSHRDPRSFPENPVFEKTQTMSKVVFGQFPVPHRPLRSTHSSLASRKCPIQHGRGTSPLQILPTRTHPYSPETAQDQLIDVFKSVGQVVGFRCVSDHSCTSFRVAAASFVSPSPVSCLTVRPVNQRAMGFASLRVHLMFLPHHANQCLDHLTLICLINCLLKTTTPQCLPSAISMELTSGAVPYE